MYELAKRTAQMIKEGIESGQIQENDENIEKTMNCVIVDIIEKERKTHVIVNETAIDLKVRKIFADILGFEC